MSIAFTRPASSLTDRFSSVIPRLSSVDILRGLVMVIMALDHTRDFFSSAQFDPTDLARTTPLLFFTRWITHFCAPIFVFLAGAGAYLSLARGKDKAALSRFLLTRGLWLIFLEIFVISPLGWSFSFSFGLTRLQVIWVIGVSMVAMAGLVLILPSRIVGAIGVVMMFTHNLFDGSHAAWLGPAAGTWKVLHQFNIFQLWPRKMVGSIYTLVPWLGVMMAGYAAGELLTLDSGRRRRALLAIGGTASILFLLLRAVNVYGDPSPWSLQATSLYTVLSFLRVSKYPPSLLYLLMTLGPGLLLLAAFDNSDGWLARKFRDFGRVPLFYYLLHLPLLHGIAVCFSFFTFGSAAWMFQDFMALRGSAHPLPAGYGYSLPVVYLVWVAAVLALYSACRWFATVKKRRREQIFSYL